MLQGLYSSIGTTDPWELVKSTLLELNSTSKDEFIVHLQNITSTFSQWAKDNPTVQNPLDEINGGLYELHEEVEFSKTFDLKSTLTGF